MFLLQILKEINYYRIQILKTDLNSIYLKAKSSNRATYKPDKRKREGEARNDDFRSLSHNT